MCQQPRQLDCTVQTPSPTTQAPTTQSPTTQSPTHSPTGAPTVQHLSLQQVMTCPKGAVSKTPSLCRSQYTQIVDRITTLMQNFDNQTCTNNVCHLADFAGCVLRAAGHDFMDFRSSPSSGGSDGCLRFKDIKRLTV